MVLTNLPCQHSHQDVLSIDVGIKNLALCHLRKTESAVFIVHWVVIDLTFEKNIVCDCGKPAHYKDVNNCVYCKKHAKMGERRVPCIIPNKCSIQTLIDQAAKYNIVEKKNTKKALYKKIRDYEFENGFLQVIEKTSANSMGMVEMGIALQTALSYHISPTCTFSQVIIENQIGPNAIRMKYLQGMIVQFFLMSPHLINNIELVSSCHKLSVYKNTKLTYSERKKKSVELCYEMIVTSSWKTYFEQHIKKDDLADCFLQGVWYLRTKFDATVSSIG